MQDNPLSIAVYMSDYWLNTLVLGLVFLCSNLWYWYTYGVLYPFLLSIVMVVKMWCNIYIYIYIYIHVYRTLIYCAYKYELAAYITTATNMHSVVTCTVGPQGMDAIMVQLEGNLWWTWRVCYCAWRTFTWMNVNKILVHKTFTISVIMGWPTGKSACIWCRMVQELLL